MNRRLLVIAVIFIIALLGMLWGISRSGPVEASYISYTQQIMSAPITVIAPAEDVKAISEIVFDIFEQVDAEMSEWKPGSPLTKVNDAAGKEPVEVPAELMRVILRGVEIGELTEGAFDITWAALWGLWDFKAEVPGVPDVAAISEQVELIDFREIVIDLAGGTVFLPRAGMVIGLGGIAKGTALDRSVTQLETQGYTSFLISAGGQVVTRGSRHDRPWKVGIRDPRGEPDDFFAKLELIDSSISTSGDYERFFILDGVRYHHILDPRTGLPTRGLRSVTVLCKDAELADALSTAMMILGLEKALALADKLEGVEAALVDDEGRLFFTSGLEGKLEISES